MWGCFGSRCCLRRVSVWSWKLCRPGLLWGRVLVMGNFERQARRRGAPAVVSADPHMCGAASEHCGGSFRLNQRRCRWKDAAVCGGTGWGAQCLEADRGRVLLLFCSFPNHSASLRSVLLP